MAHRDSRSRYTHPRRIVRGCGGVRRSGARDVLERALVGRHGTRPSVFRGWAIDDQHGEVAEHRAPRARSHLVLLRSRGWPSRHRATPVRKRPWSTEKSSFGCPSGVAVPVTTRVLPANRRSRARPPMTTNTDARTIVAAHRSATAASTAGHSASRGARLARRRSRSATAPPRCIRRSSGSFPGTQRRTYRRSGRTPRERRTASSRRGTGLRPL